MAGIGFTPQQQQAIQTYRKQNNIASVISDEAVANMIKEKGGQLASIFNSNTYSWSAAQPKLPDQGNGTIFGQKKTRQQPAANNTQSKPQAQPKQSAATMQQQIQNALDKSTDDLLTMQAEINGKKFKKGFNEINVYNPEIKALYIRDNSADGKLEDMLSDKLLQFAQDNNIPIVFQRNVIDS
ncbi:hypothetical protein IAC76_01655 [Spirochaetes bacterium]|uniref:Uncharacterized protein n=1 Tax=Candidatus Scatousia excrementipullorum TaxID=2840936 RepID=A0A9D9GYS8_9BACT|nr:hypothetical protein [Candidatus Scatousia excrementipullorum]